MILDNLAAHHNISGPGAGRGRGLVHLPAYLPDLNPVEKAFFQVKAVPRTLAWRIVPQSPDAIPKTLADVTAQEAIGLIGHGGCTTTWWQPL